MRLDRQYPWNLQLTTHELGVIRKLLKGIDLTPEEETEADRLSNVVEDIYERLRTKTNDQDLEISPPREYLAGTQRRDVRDGRDARDPAPGSRSHRAPLRH